MRFDLPDDKKFVYQTRIPMRWGDMDAMGHVNNTVYFRYMEIVRIDWLYQLTGKPDLAGTGPVVVNSFCNFIKQLQYPGEVVARLFIAAPGRTSFDTYLTLARSDAPDVVCASGGATTVWVDYRAKKSVALPESVRQLFG